MVGDEAVSSLTRRWRELSLRVFSHFTPPPFADQPELLRRARLIIGFAILGGWFGMSFAAFYGLIGHVWGAAIILICCAAFAGIPHILRQSGSADRAGNWYCLVLNTGFFALCWVEGGIRGHALAWLVAVPLLALLLTSRRAAYGWCTVALAAAAIVGGAEFTPYAPPILYPMEWHHAVSALGYLSLVAFMFILGLIFETGRATAQARMLQTMGELAEANRHLTRLNEEKNEFLGIAAHDLRNPLSVVMSYSELIQMEDAKNARLQRFASVIRKESTRMRDLIANLLDLNAIESGKNRFENEAVALNPLVQRAVENLRAVADKKQIGIVFEESETLCATAEGNALLQVLDNLISNAVKFSKPGKQVTVSLGRQADRVLLSVSDQGPGITPADRAKLFKRFSKLSARPTAGESSNGLGLSIVKRLVEAMQGTIECTSEVGQGTTFTVSLAFAPNIAVLPEPAAATSPPSPNVIPFDGPSLLNPRDDSATSAKAS